MDPSQHVQAKWEIRSILCILFAAFVASLGIPRAAHAEEPVRPSASSLINELRDAPDGLGLERVARQLAKGVPHTFLNLFVQAEGGGSAVVVAPGAELRYEVTGLLDNNTSQGLALVGFTLTFDGGDLPQADEPTGEPTPGCDNPLINFTRPWGITNPAGYGGTIINGDLVQVGGGQNTINNTPDNADFPIGPVLTGVALPGGCGTATLATGSLIAPQTAGVYTLEAVDVFGNVIRAEAPLPSYWPVEAFGVGNVSPLTITVLAGDSMEVRIDIEPSSCQNLLSRDGRDRLRVVLLGSASFNVADVAPDSILLGLPGSGTPSVFPLPMTAGDNFAIADICGQPDDGPFECGTAEPDGFDDLVLDFSARELLGVIRLREVQRHATVTLALRGRLLDGRTFEAGDSVSVAPKRRQVLKPKGR
jgi:hypothetical protein